MEERFTKPIWGWPRKIQFDENTIVCVSNPKSGTLKKITFDYWHDRPPGEEYNAWYAKAFPMAGTVSADTRHADCANRAMPGHSDYRNLDAIIEPPRGF